MVLGSVAGAATFAQQAQPQRAPAERTAPTAGQAKAQHDSKFDEHVASCLILENEGEIAAAKLAEQRAGSDDVKQFAQKMVKDHRQFISDLEKFGGAELRNRRQSGDNKTSGTTRTDNAAPRESRNDGRAATNNTAAGTPRAGNTAQRSGQDPYAIMLAVKEEMADECQVSTRRELDSKKGEEFDECYMGMQIGAHMHMIDSLKVLERHVSPEFQSGLQKGLQTAQQHFDQAKKIKKNVSHTQSANSEKTVKSE